MLLFVSYDDGREKGEPFLSVGTNLTNSKIMLLNSFSGDEANDIFNRLVSNDKLIELNNLKKEINEDESK